MSLVPCYFDKVGSNLHGGLFGKSIVSEICISTNQLIFSFIWNSPVFIPELWHEKKILFERNTMEFVKLKVAPEATHKSYFEQLQKNNRS